MKYNWLIKSCKRTGWVQGDGKGGEEFNYEGVFITDTCLTPMAEFTTLRVRFWAEYRGGPAKMRAAIKTGLMSHEELQEVIGRRP